MPSEAQIEALREWLRDPENEIGSGAPTAVHRQQLEDIWHEALDIARGDIPEALSIAAIATDTDVAPGESRNRNAGDARLLFQYRQDGIPSRAFGVHGDYVGEDKVKHFFRCAELAYKTHFESGVRFAGKAYEAWNWVAGLWDGTGKYDQGDIWADNLGAAFGMMLVDDPRHSIYRFLQNPDQDVLVIDGVAVYDGDYVAEIIIPSPRFVEQGKSIELRMIDGNGNPYVIVFQGHGAGVRYLRTNSSNYYIAKNDPWYRPAQERGRIDLRPGHATPRDRAIRREIKTKEGMYKRVSNNIQQNRRRQEQLEEEMQSNPIMSQRVNHETLNDWIREDRQRQDRIREDIDRLQNQLRELRQPHASTEHTHNTISERRPSYNPVYPQPDHQPLEPLHRNTAENETIAAQGRAQLVHRQAEERAEQQRKADEERRIPEQQKQHHDQAQEQHRQHHEQIQRHHEHQKPHHDPHQQQREIDQQQKLNDKGLFS
jgi:hypothetical protein